jgi:diguanylate cyclase (GGDEF)-like protein
VNNDIRTVEMLQATLAQTRAELASARTRMAELERAALADPLTGLPNRAAFNATLATYASGLDAFAVLMIDLDKFKPINDTYGHAAGDMVLITMSRRLRSLIVTGGIACRLGGDEFAVLAISPSPAISKLLALDVHRLMTEPIEICGEVLVVGASVGVAHAFPAEADRAVGAADWAMYRAKASGGGLCEHDPLTALPVVEQRPLIRARELRHQLEAVAA